jgi:magnesium-transporting ATPase (P-type)
MVAVLAVAAVVTYVIGERIDTVVISVIVLLNAAVGFAEEYRAERSMAALRRLTATRTAAVRDGSLMVVAALALGVLAQLTVVYAPDLQRAFGTTSLTPLQLAVSLLLSTVVFVAVELEKGWHRRRLRRRVSSSA